MNDQKDKETNTLYGDGTYADLVMRLRHGFFNDTDELNQTMHDAAFAIEERSKRIIRLESAIDKMIIAIGNSKLVPKPGMSVHGQTIDANIKASDYLRVDAWPFEELYNARYDVE